jgi:hypothetical protein
MVIAIDYDRTWTADPAGWVQWYYSFTARGHQVIMATGRNGWSDDMDRSSLPASMPIVFCKGQLKRIACEQAGYNVDVWIDDMPGMIERSMVLVGDEV